MNKQIEQILTSDLKLNKLTSKDGDEVVFVFSTSDINSYVESLRTKFKQQFGNEQAVWDNDQFAFYIKPAGCEQTKMYLHILGKNKFKFVVPIV